MQLHLDVTLGWPDAPWIAVLACYLLWIGYLALTNLERARSVGALTKAARVGAAPLLLIFGPLDVLVNWTVGTLLFLEFPREFTLSKRCTRHYNDAGFRGRVSRWLGRNALDPYDHRGAHVNPAVLSAYKERNHG